MLINKFNNLTFQPIIKIASNSLQIIQKSYHVVEYLVARSQYRHAMNTRELANIRLIAKELSTSDGSFSPEVEKIFFTIFKDPVGWNKKLYHSRILSWKQYQAFGHRDYEIEGIIRELGKLTRGLSQIKKITPDLTTKTKKIAEIAQNQLAWASLKEEEKLTRHEAFTLYLLDEAYQKNKKFTSRLSFEKDIKHEEFYKNCSIIIQKAWENPFGADNKTLAFYSKRKYDAAKLVPKTWFSCFKGLFSRLNHFHSSHLYTDIKNRPVQVHVTDKYCHTELRFSELLNNDLISLKIEKLILPNQREQLFNLLEINGSSEDFYSQLDEMLGKEVKKLIQSKEYHAIHNWSLGKALALFKWFGFPRDSHTSRKMICSEYMVVLFARAITNMNENLRLRAQEKTGIVLSLSKDFIHNPFKEIRAKWAIPSDIYNKVKPFGIEYENGSPFLSAILE